VKAPLPRYCWGGARLGRGWKFIQGGTLTPKYRYHSRVILDIIDDFSYMKSLYDFTISLNHI